MSYYAKKYSTYLADSLFERLDESVGQNKLTGNLPKADRSF